MPYQAFKLPRHVGPRVSWVVRETVDLRFWDVHAMLRLPLPSLEIPMAGGNFAIADVLFGVIEGVAAVLYPRYGEEGSIFATCMRDHYHVECEPPGALPTAEVTQKLWQQFRNPMQHCLGLAMAPPDRQGARELRLRQHQLTVFRDTQTLSEAEIESLETAAGWPSRLSRPTLAAYGDELILSVEAFYVGTRRLIDSILSDSEITQAAEDQLEPYFRERGPPPPFAPPPSGAPARYTNTTSGATANSQATSYVTDPWNKR